MKKVEYIHKDIYQRSFIETCCAQNSRMYQLFFDRKTKYTLPWNSFTPKNKKK